MNILFVSWELDPLFKMGGLGDVARSLPGALSRMGVDTRNILPYYNAVKTFNQRRKKVGRIFMEFDGKISEVIVYEIMHPVNKIPVYLLKNDEYFGVARKLTTFSFFDKAVVEIVRKNILKWTPDVIHCNDHHAGLIPLLLREYKMPIKSMFTIHNLAYQGITSLDLVDKLGIHKSKVGLLAWEIESRQLNFMMEGIIHADVVTTVSPTYAKEIMQERYGMGLDEILRGKESRVFGILNGIDRVYKKKLHRKNVWYPYLPGEVSDEEKTCYLHDWEQCKRNNKKFLQKKLGFKVSEDIPLFIFIGRIDPNQKGMDILHKMFRRINIEKIQFALLGTGSPEWEERFTWLSTFYPKNASCNFKFDEVLASQMYASADFILVPSKFEPCGLVQMLAMFFGTIPIAHRTGGLADSIKEGVNGFLFSQYSSVALEKTLKKAINVWRQKKGHFRKMVEAAMTADFSWDKSAGEYVKLYERLARGEL